MANPSRVPESPAAGAIPLRLVIVLNSLPVEQPQSMSVPLRYAATAASMDVAVEVHAVNRTVALLSRSACTAELLMQIRQAVEEGVHFFACPVAMAEQGLSEVDLIEEVSGVRGAASLLVAGLQPGARFMVF